MTYDERVMKAVREHFHRLPDDFLSAIHTYMIENSIGTLLTCQFHIHGAHPDMLQWLLYDPVWSIILSGLGSEDTGDPCTPAFNFIQIVYTRFLV